MTPKATPLEKHFRVRVETPSPGHRDSLGPSTLSEPDKARIGILYENPNWTFDLADLFDHTRFDLRTVDASRWSFDLESLPEADVWFNRVSPSAHSRGNGSAVSFAANLLEALESAGTDVINGSRSFALETSKISQHLLLERLGLRTPRTHAFNSRESLRAAAFELDYPRIIKPNMGGSGVGVVRIESALDLLSQVDSLAFGPDGVLLAQELLPAGQIVRTEFMGDELVYAMRVEATNTFNLCPAEFCVRTPTEDGLEARVDFEAYFDLDPAAIEESRKIVEAAGLSVGGVEFVESSSGERTYFDVNATSVHRQDMSRAWGRDPNLQLVELLSARARVGRTRRGS